MCGIAGLTTLGSEQPVDAELLECMLARLTHRGPDERGSIAFPRVAMGNTRLSILDLEHGRQPIANEDGSVVVVYNGELYNFPELRQELIAKGHQFRTTTDTEVLVHLYEEEGETFMRRMNGMFAFALYDRNREVLIVARDRFGVKPLFYAQAGERLYFASEIKALRIAPDVSSALSPEGLSVALGLFFLTEPWTIYRDIRRLRPGHYLKVDRSGVSIARFADWNLRDKSPIGAAEAAERTAELLIQSVRRQMISDVPVGVLLSGGLDSRSIHYLATRQDAGATAFTVTFAESAFDEGGEAAAWAQALGTPHRGMRFGVDDFCDDYPERQRHLDEPYALWCNVASARLARFIHASGYKVVLGGDGGDELFLGYPTVQAAQLAKAYHRLPNWLRKRAIEPLVHALPAGTSRLPWSFMARSFIDADDPDIFRTFFGFKEVVRFRDWPTLLTSEAYALVKDIDPFIAHAQYLPEIRDLDFVDALSYLDFKVFMPGASLYGADNAYMASSVELRVPFLDNDLADFAASLPVSVRYSLRRTKPVLREALTRHILGKAEIGARAALRGYRKAGFEVPGSVWMRTPRFRQMIEDILSPARLERTGFFRVPAVRRLLDEQLSSRRNHERVLQALCSIVLFLDR